MITQLPAPKLEKKYYSGLMMLVGAFAQIADIMRNHTVESFSEEIGYIYAMLTNNEQMMTLYRREQTSIVSVLRPEIRWFIDNRIVYLVNTITDKIRKDFPENNTPPAKIKIGDMRYDTLNAANLHQLQLLEFDVLQICRIVNKAIELDSIDVSSQSRVTIDAYDLPSILHFLLNQFSLIAGQINVSSNSRPMAKIVLRNDNDCGSTQGLVILAYLISKVAICLLQIKTDERFDKVAMEKESMAMVNDEYVKYSNLGPMQLSGILACFNTDIFPAAVCSNRGHLGTNEKTFLLNILTASKLCQTL